MAQLCCLATVAILVGLLIRSLVTKRRIGERLIVARYRDRCSDCGRPTEPGANVFWEKGRPVRHENCERENLLSDEQVLSKALERLTQTMALPTRTRIVQEANAKLWAEASRSKLLALAQKAGLEADAAADAELLTTTIAKLEAAKGRSTRQTVLEAAVKRTKSEATHQRLVLEASRISARAMIDKADGLKTKSARRRILQEALRDVRSDSIPDALQGDELSWLEAALKALDDD